MSHCGKHCPECKVEREAAVARALEASAARCGAALAAAAAAAEAERQRRAAAVAAHAVVVAEHKAAARAYEVAWRAQNPVLAAKRDAEDAAARQAKLAPYRKPRRL